MCPSGYSWVNESVRDLVLNVCRNELRSFCFLPNLGRKGTSKKSPKLEDKNGKKLFFLPAWYRWPFIAHAEMFNEVVSMDVNFWSFNESHSREVKTLTVLNIVDAASDTSHSLWKAFANGWLLCAGAPKCLRVDPHRAQNSKDFFRSSRRTRNLCEPCSGCTPLAHGASPEPCEASCTAHWMVAETMEFISLCSWTLS